MEAVVRRLETLALPAVGRSQGISPVISAKILVQEAIRVARAGGTSLRKIFLCCPDEKAFKSFEKTVRGYLRHFLDVLIWGPFVTVDAIIQVPAGIVLIEGAIRRWDSPFREGLSTTGRAWKTRCAERQKRRRGSTSWTWSSSTPTRTRPGTRDSTPSPRFSARAPRPAEGGR